jgi:predicted TIM-barrel fold metal-dependent hydrolase
MKDSVKLYNEIKGAVDKISIIDTHEHLIQEPERIRQTPDMFETLLAHYLSSDLVSSGMSLDALAELRNPQHPLTDRWKIFKPFWERTNNTGYAYALKIAVKGLYNIDELSDRTYQELAARMEKRNQAGLYHWILKEKAGIDRIILDTSPETPLTHVDYNLFAPVFRFRDFIMVKSRPELEHLEKWCGLPIHSLKDFVTALNTEFDRVQNSIVGVKIGLAYMRTLRFDKVTFNEAEEVFNNIYRQETFERIVVENKHRYVPAGLSLRDSKPLQDFLVHTVIQLAAKRGLPIQIHTGLHEGNENILVNSRPTLLVNLFREYKEARFDVFHGSYPYTGELAALAKNFPNVYADLCWLHIISPFKARQTLSEWLDTIPSNKILGFGGDYRFIEGVYGHAVIARENIARVLTEKVEEGNYGKDEAVQLARKLLRGNAHDLFFPQQAEHTSHSSIG